jgi:hypothetical protein
MYTFNAKISEEDFIDYNMFHIKHSKVVKRTKIGLSFVFPVGFTILGLLIDRPLSTSFWIILAIGTVGTYLWIPRLMDKTTQKRIRKMLNEGKNGELFDERTYAFDDQGIKVTSENSSNSYKWQSITRIAENETTFYLYVSSLQAILVPKRFLETQEQVDAFRTYIESFVKA